MSAATSGELTLKHLKKVIEEMDKAPLTGAVSARGTVMFTCPEKYYTAVLREMKKGAELRDALATLPPEAFMAACKSWERRYDDPNDTTQPE